MMASSRTIRVQLAEDEFKQLANVAARELRPVHWQAAVLLREALGLPKRSDPSPEQLERRRRQLEAEVRGMKVLPGVG